MTVSLISVPLGLREDEFSPQVLFLVEAMIIPSLVLGFSMIGDDFSSSFSRQGKASLSLQ